MIEFYTIWLTIDRFFFSSAKKMHFLGIFRKKQNDSCFFYLPVKKLIVFFICICVLIIPCLIYFQQIRAHLFPVICINELQEKNSSTDFPFALYACSFLKRSHNSVNELLLFLVGTCTFHVCCSSITLLFCHWHH